MKFEEATKESIKYLKSDAFKNREDAEDTIPQVHHLIKINELGFLTTDSQQGRNYSGFNEDNGKYYEIRERAYINGFMKREDALKFIEYLNSYTDKIAFFIYNQSGKEFEDIFYKQDPKLIPSIPVTVSSSAKTKKDLTKFYSHTKIPTIFPESLYNFEKKQKHLNKSEDVLIVCVIDSVYGRKAPSLKGLYNDIYHALGSK